MACAGRRLRDRLADLGAHPASRPGGVVTVRQLPPDRSEFGRWRPGRPMGVRSGGRSGFPSRACLTGMQIAYVAVTIVVAFANGYAAVFDFARAKSVKVVARHAPRPVRKILVPNGPGHSPWLRAERREQGGGDQAGRVPGVEPPGGGVLGGGVHEAVRGGDQPLPRHVAAEGPGALALLDQGLHAAQDPVVDAADALGREFALRGQQDVAELVRRAATTTRPAAPAPRPGRRRCRWRPGSRRPAARSGPGRRRRDRRGS